MTTLAAYRNAPPEFWPTLPKFVSWSNGDYWENPHFPPGENGWQIRYGSDGQLAEWVFTDREWRPRKTPTNSA